MKVLTVGATGDFAGLVVPELKRQNITVRALLHRADEEQVGHDAGADETVVADLTDYDSLVTATAGVDGVFHLNPAFAPHESQLGLNMVRAAGESGVKKFVFSSVYHPSLSLVNHAEKRPVEEALYESNLTFVILQPAMFMQMLARGGEKVKREGVLSGPYSVHSKMSYVDYREVAEVVGLAFAGDRLDYGTFELCSPGMYDRDDLARLWSKKLNRKVTAAATAPPPPKPTGSYQDKAMQAMLVHYDKYGFRGGNALVLECILGRPPRTVAEFMASL